MSIILTCDCGKKLKVGHDKAGKRVKCPGCQDLLTVPAPESNDEPEPPRKSKSKPAPVEAPDDEDEAPPTRKNKAKPAPDSEDNDEEEEERPRKSKKGGSGTAKKSSSGMLVVLLGLAAFVLLGGCGGGGFAIWYFAFSGPSTTTMIGTGKDKDKVEKDKGGKTGQDTIIEPRARFNAELGKEGDSKKVATLLLSHDGRRMAISNGIFQSVRKAQVWDIESEPKKLREFDGSLWTMSPDGKRAILEKKLERILVDPESGAEIARGVTASSPWIASNKAVWDFGVPFSDTKKQKKIRVVRFDALSGKKDKELEIDAKGERSTPIPSKEAYGFVTKNGEVHLWDSTTEKWAPPVTLKLDAGESLLLPAAAFAISPDGKWLLAMAGTKTFDPAVFDLTTGAGTKLPKQKMFPRTPVFVANRDILMVNSSASTNKDQVAAYDLKTNAVVATFGSMDGTVHALAVSGDGSTMAAGSADGNVLIWDLKKLP